MYITKKQLEKEIMQAYKDYNKTITLKPLQFTFASIGIIILIAALIPVLASWLVLWILYMPLSIIDSFIVKLWRRYK